MIICEDWRTTKEEAFVKGGDRDRWHELVRLRTTPCRDMSIQLKNLFCSQPLARGSSHGIIGLSRSRITNRLAQVGVGGRETRFRSIACSPFTVAQLTTEAKDLPPECECSRYTSPSRI